METPPVFKHLYGLIRLLPRLAERQSQTERAASANTSGVDIYRPPVRLHELTYQGQPNAQALPLMGGMLMLRLAKEIKYVLHILLA
jgi:hypothetical protein